MGSERSQVSCIGEALPASWDDYERGCLMTFGGGYQTEAEREIFRHGMTTVFNLLRAEFPPAGLCRTASDLLAVCYAARHFEIRGEMEDGTRWCDYLDAAIAKAEGR